MGRGRCDFIVCASRSEVCRHERDCIVGLKFVCGVYQETHGWWGGKRRSPLGEEERRWWSGADSSARSDAVVVIHGTQCCQAGEPNESTQCCPILRVPRHIRSTRLSTYTMHQRAQPRWYIQGKACRVQARGHTKTHRFTFVSPTSSRVDAWVTG